MSEPELARPDAAEADVSGADKKKAQLKAARELKAEKKRKRESQLDDIEARLASLASILPKKEKATSVEVSEDEEEEEEKDISEPAPKKKVRITREVPTKEEDEDDEQAEGWGPFIFRTALPVLLPAVSYATSRVFQRTPLHLSLRCKHNPRTRRQTYRCDLAVCKSRHRHAPYRHLRHHKNLK